MKELMDLPVKAVLFLMNHHLITGLLEGPLLRKRSNRYDDHRSPPVPYGEKPSYENRQDRRRDYDRPSDTYRTRQTSREEYRDNHRNRSDLVDPRRPERSFKSPPRSDRYPCKKLKIIILAPAHRAEPRGEPLNEDIIQDSIFVSNLPLDAIVTEIASLFGSIGVIKTDKKTGIPKIKLYYHPNGNPKGEASVYYQDSQAARAAIEWFNRNIPFSHTVDSELRGNTLKVQMAERTYSASYISGRGNRGNFRGSSRGRDDRVFSRNLPPDFGEEELSRGRPKPACVIIITLLGVLRVTGVKPQKLNPRSPQRGPPTFQAPSSGYRYT
ncbi:LOW QUALITY PROTEIN: hypothetical protein MXB_2947 [Myxobolus squamalis]|nr:LOW QUALITY PROTEIN: hypothetical protein MXB_2947 [Myxobolus squamalis]